MQSHQGYERNEDAGGNRRNGKTRKTVQSEVGDLPSDYAVGKSSPHATHERAHMPAPHTSAILNEQISQHAAAREGILQVQLINASHQGQVLRTDGLTLVARR